MCIRDSLGTVSAADKAVNNQKLREVFPVAEKLKNRLLEHYKKEYERHMRDKVSIDWNI